MQPEAYLNWFSKTPLERLGFNCFLKLNTTRGEIVTKSSYCIMRLTSYNWPSQWENSIVCLNISDLQSVFRLLLQFFLNTPRCAAGVL